MSHQSDKEDKRGTQDAKEQEDNCDKKEKKNKRKKRVSDRKRRIKAVFDSVMALVAALSIVCACDDD